MKLNKYIIIIVVVMLILTPLVTRDSVWRIIFECISFIIFFTLIISAWRERNKNAVIAYTFLIVISTIQLFDKEDRYFFVQVILLMIMLVLAILKSNRSENKNGIE